MTPSEQITALCDELQIEKPATVTRIVTEDHISKRDFKATGPNYIASNLLKWLANLHHDEPFIIEIDGGIFGAGTVDGSWSAGFDLDVYDDDPERALQLLAVKRLQEIKRERSNDK